jgi:hypothetical protein
VRRTGKENPGDKDIGIDDDRPHLRPRTFLIAAVTSAGFIPAA